MTVNELFQLFLYINALLIVITIMFVKPRRVQSIYLWIAAFLLLPILFVLVFYLFFGRDYRRAKLFKSKGPTDRLGTDLLRKMREKLFVCSADLRYFADTAVSPSSCWIRIRLWSRRTTR